MEIEEFQQLRDHYKKQVLSESDLIKNEADPQVYELEKKWQISLDENSWNRDLAPNLSLPEVVMHYVNSGEYPPPEIMLCLRDAFTKYFDGEENLELEHTLLPKRIPRAGSYRNRRNKEKVYRRYRNFTLQKNLAESTSFDQFNYRAHNFTSAESFERAYFRNKRNKASTDK